MTTLPETPECADCGQPGEVSDWPGNDPANAGSETLILCVSKHSGELVCDDCEQERDNA